MNHVFIGTVIPFLFALVVYLCCRARAGLRMLILTPLFMAVGVVWALVPDIPLLFGSTRWYIRIHRSAWVDLFFFHGRIDQIEKRIVFEPWNMVLTVVMAASVMVAAWRELRIREKDGA